MTRWICHLAWNARAAFRPLRFPVARAIVAPRTLHATLAGAFLLLASSPLIAAQQYTFSYGPTTAEYLHSNRWQGRHSFLDVYCVDFPDPLSVEKFSEGLLNGNTISWFRVIYRPKHMVAYIVTSTIPRGRSETAEFDALLGNEERNAAAVNTLSTSPRYLVATGQAAWGPLIEVKLTNVTERNPDGVFPLTRPLLREGDGPPYSRSAHRLFAHGSNRFEIAVMGVPADPGPNADMAALEARIAGLADRLVASLQTCTTHMESGHGKP